MSFARRVSCSVLAALLLFAGCGGDCGPRLRWTYALEPEPGTTQPPRSVDADALVEAVRARLAKSLRRATDVRTEGEHTLVIEGPAELDFRSTPVAAPLRAALDAGGTRLSLAAASAAADSTVLAGDAADARAAFPEEGGIVTIDEEWLEFARRTGDELGGLVRGAFGTRAVRHEAGAMVHLWSRGALAATLTRRGELGFHVDAACTRLPGPIVLAEEAARLDAWSQDHPGARLQEYNAVASEAGGPPAGTRWFEGRAKASRAGSAPPARFLLRVDGPNFGNADLRSIEVASDELGYPALQLELVEARRQAFSDWTAGIVGCGLAITIDDEALTVATVMDRLPGSCVVSGGTVPLVVLQAEELANAVRAGALQALLRLVKVEAAGGR